ncbi:hypothetical protein FOZ63_003320, partial [Perkinsus olseni]
MDTQTAVKKDDEIVVDGQTEMDDLLFAQKMAEVELRAMPSSAPLNPVAPTLLLRKEAQCRDYDDLSDDDDDDDDDDSDTEDKQPAAPQAQAAETKAPIMKEEAEKPQKAEDSLSKPAEYQKEKSMLDAVIAGSNLDVIEDDESDTADEEGETLIGSLAALEDTIPA